jgi:glutamate/tyrosine decarboxylase-like PLP-dependent enzyme
MREMGYRTVDLVVDRLADPGEWPALRRGTPEEMAARLGDPPTEAGEPFGALLERLAGDVLDYASRCDHPGYFAFIPGCPTFPGALGDFVASALNVYAGSWMEAAGPSQVELEVLGWFKSWLGYPGTAGGSLVSGGSAANLTALACAREARAGAMAPDLVLYVSDQAHSSIARAARILGFRPEQVRVLPTGADLRLRAAVVDAAMEADVAAGRRPLLASVSAGATNTGIVDPLGELAAAAHAHGAWLHVDAAYGGFAALTERGSALLEGIAAADSITLDPHKWLYQPFECGCVLVRDGELLRRAFTLTPDYLADAEAGAREVNFSDLGLQLTRGARAFKVWLSVRHFGVAAFRAAIDTAIDLAQLAERHVREHEELELLSPANLGIICFRRRVPGADAAEHDRANAALVRAYAATGAGLASSTRLHGAYAIRLCALNHTSTPAHVRAMLDWFAGAPLPSPRAAAGARTGGRGAVIGDAGAGGASPRAGDLDQAPLLDELGDAERELLLATSRTVRRGAGDAVVRRWETSRDAYVLLSGTAEVRRDGRALARLEAGDFFGELAALDWGAGYGYPRLADVVALEPLRLLVVPPDTLRELMVRSPVFAATVRAAVEARLAVV